MKKNRIPLAISISYNELSFFNKYKQLSYDKTQHVLLESRRGGRYSIAAIDPIGEINAKNGCTTIKINGQVTEEIGNPFLIVEKWMKQWKSKVNLELPDFQGGAIGFISYDSIHYFEDIPSEATDDLNVPDLYFLIFNDVAVYDHEKKLLWLITHYTNEMEKLEGERRLEEWKNSWLLQEEINPVYNYEQKACEEEPIVFEKESFEKAVQKVKSYISAGDVFQVNLSVRHAKPVETHPFNIYMALRDINPSPYMAYIHTPDFQIVSGSPELLIKKKEKKLSTRPIAGTRSRGKNAKEDIKLAYELINNKKERAEHVMLVDLERNDLGRVCEYGTVEVDEFMVIEKYSHVMHIVSNVTGILKNDKGFSDIFEGVFPGGTITGAPKIRTMEIIEELEPTKRGIYTGSIGWIGFNEDLEFNIVIRTLFVKNGYGYVQAGAGIVIDSKAENEYKESLKKSAAVWQAKETSEKYNR
ncbi:TPA: anthranilate synthase component I family protein [Bacillus anthracis]|nr:anthranilate synthase component I family protein [Bacillus anthracis]